MTLPEASNAPAPEQKKPRKKPERAEAGFNLQYMPYIIEHHRQLEQTKTKTPAVGKKLRQELDEIDTHFTLTLQALIQSTIISCRKQEAARREWLLEFTAKAKASACDVTELQVVLAKAPEDSFLELEASLSEFKQQGAAARNKRQRQQRLQFKDDSEAGSQQEPTANKDV